MEKYNIRLPNGTTIEREMEREQAEYWISIAMCISHGLNLISLSFVADQMDDQANVPIPEVDEDTGMN